MWCSPMGLTLPWQIAVADRQQGSGGSDTKCCSAATLLYAAPAKHTVKAADALRCSAFLDVSSLNFGGATSTAVFLSLLPHGQALTRWPVMRAPSRWFSQPLCQSSGIMASPTKAWEAVFF